MRIVRDISDVGKALKELFDWKEKLSTKLWDFHQLRITNAAAAIDGHDYVILDQLKEAAEAGPTPLDYYTIVFSSNGTVADGETSPPFIVGVNREGDPIQVWVACEGAPPDDDLTINVDVTYTDPIGNVQTTTSLLLEPLALAINTTLRVFSSTFTDPIPKFGLGTKVNKVIVTGGGASDVSIGVVVKIIR